MATTKVKFNDYKPFMLPELIMDVVKDLDDSCTYDLSITKHADKKTVSQNAYFHKLVDILRLEMDWSFTRMKNHLVGSYGAILGENLVMLTVPPEEMREVERPHTKYVKTDIVTDSYGVEFEGHWYRLYKNVADMNTYEMAKLITGTVQECENLGLDVITPDEKAYLEELLRGNNEKVDSCES